MFRLWDQARPGQINLSPNFDEELLCSVAEIWPRLENEILEIVKFSFFVTRLREPCTGGGVTG